MDRLPIVFCNSYRMTLLCSDCIEQCIQQLNDVGMLVGMLIGVYLCDYTYLPLRNQPNLLSTDFLL